MFQLRHYQLNIMKNCSSNQKQALKEQLTGINISQNQKHIHESDV